MKDFTQLYVELDQTNKTNEKVLAMADYFAAARPEDAAWAFYFLSGRKPRQIVPSAKLREWAIEEAGIPEWLYQESRDTVGDSAETIALLLPNNSTQDETPLRTLIEEKLLPLRGADPELQRQAVTEAWSRMNY
ncbi:MAG: ATP-dependent DNA ligase, partial [Pyrinomonadaceae bacterium]|nr:ATP-dependent DNA ligase [Pyrinomonadaceae bacterium]